VVLGHQRRSVRNTEHPIGLHDREAVTMAWTSDRLASAECPRDPDSRDRSQHWGIHGSIYSCDGASGNREIRLCMPPGRQAASDTTHSHPPFPREAKL
jgi:hypothetical protein